MSINSEPGHIWAVNYGDNGRPAGVGPVIIDNLEELIPSGSGGHTYTGGNGIDVDNVNDTISLDSETQAAINSYVTNSGSFLTSDDLNGYATENWVEEKNYITSADIPPIPSDVVTSAELATVSGEIVNQIPDVTDMATQTWVQNQGYISSIPSEYVTDTEMSTYVAGQTSAFVTSADIPEVPDVKDLVAGNGINITTTSADVTISADTSVLATQADLGPYATQTWTSTNFFPIDGLQIVGSSAEASGANIIYIVTGSNQ